MVWCGVALTLFGLFPFGECGDLSSFSYIYIMYFARRLQARGWFQSSPGPVEVNVVPGFLDLLRPTEQ